MHFFLDVLGHMPIDYVVPEKVSDFLAVLTLPIDELVVGVNVGFDISNNI